MPQFFLAPGIYPTEVDLLGRTRAIASTIGAVVFGSKKGTLAAKLITGGRQEFVDEYGAPDVSWSYGHHSSLAFLVPAKAMWAKRVINGARHAGLTISNDLNGGGANSTFILPFESGTFNDYTNPQEFQTLVFSAALVASNSISIDITNGTTPVNVTTVYSGSSDATMQAIATALQTAINNNYAINGLNAGAVSVVKVGATATDDRILCITSPENVDLTISAAAVTLGSSQASITISSSPWLLRVYAENPGDWGSNSVDGIGIAIRNVDQGVNQRIRLTFSGVIATGQTFQAALNVNGQVVQVGPIAYATSNNATMTTIKDALKTALGIGSDALLVTGGANILEIIMVAPDDGPNYFSVIAATVTGSGSPPTVTNTQDLAGIAADDTFEIWVYSRNKITAPIEKFTVSFKQQLDGYGKQQFVEQVINKAAGKSRRIRVAYNANNISGQLKSVNTLTAADPVWALGGSNGSLPLSSHIKAGWDDFQDRQDKQIRLLINAGYSAVTVQQYMVALAEKRYDCFAILDMPSDQQAAVDAVNYRNNTLNINSSYGAIYTPDVEVEDDFTNLDMFLPPSGFVAAAYAINDVQGDYLAPAGLERGLIEGIKGLRYKYKDGDCQLLFPNKVNYILSKPGKGYSIDSAETLLGRDSGLSNINVRRMLITIEVGLVDALDYSKFRPDDENTWFEIKQLCDNTLQPLKNKRALKRFQSICDKSNNGPVYQDQGLVNATIILIPNLPVKFISLQSVVGSAGMTFSEIVGLLNGG